MKLLEQKVEIKNAIKYSKVLASGTIFSAKGVQGAQAPQRKFGTS